VRSARALILGGLVIVSVSLASCDMVGERGSGNLTTQPVTLDGDVDRVEVGSAFWVRVTVGAPEPQAEVTIDDNLVDRLRVRQEGSTLVVEIDGSVQNATMRALVSLPSLRGVRASGASTIEVVGEATGDLEAEASGASTIEATGIDLDRFGVDVSARRSGRRGIRLGGGRQRGEQPRLVRPAGRLGDAGRLRGVLRRGRGHGRPACGRIWGIERPIHGHGGRRRGCIGREHRGPRLRTEERMSRDHVRPATQKRRRPAQRSQWRGR
jgi:hypothetical protein